MRTLEGLPQHQDIVKYWASAGDARIPVDRNSPECFACRIGVTAWPKLQRCHIVAASIGGTCAPSNLILLCAWCHKESPMTTDADFLLAWVTSHENWGAKLYRDVATALVPLLADLKWTEADHQQYLAFLRMKRLQFHPHSSQAEKCAILSRLAHSYMELRDKVFAR